MSKLAVLFSVLSVVSGALVQKSYYNGDDNTYNPSGNVEYHCFTTESGLPTYVRGTYGMRGYFEGYVSNYTATVNWYEITLGSSVMVPSTGAAIIKYDHEYNYLSGNFWNAGECDIFDSTGSWGITGACLDCFAAVSTMQGCFYDDTNVRNGMATDLIGQGKANYQIFGDGTNPNVFNHVNLGPSDTGGHLVGGYVYVYSDEECTEGNLPCGTAGNVETGHYGLAGISANGDSLNIMATTWNAATGPAAGTYGSALYAFIPVQVATDDDDDTAVGFVDELSLYGLFCNAELAALSEKGVLTSGCTVETGAYVETSKAESQKLMAPYELLTQPGAAKSPIKILQGFTQVLWPRASNIFTNFFASRVSSSTDTLMELFYTGK